MKLLITLGGGGHTAEAIRVVREIGPGFDYHYLYIDEETKVRDAVPFPGVFHEVARPRHRDDGIAKAVVKVIRHYASIARVVNEIRPDAVIGCGPSLSVLAMWAGKFAGAKIVFIETAARVTSTSLSAKLVYPIADLFFVQWPELLRRLPRAEYHGRI
jgi:UDP-N-acetylglucosamine:LPS N-acetylglucosamine transferase